MNWLRQLFSRQPDRPKLEVITMRYDGTPECRSKMYDKMGALFGHDAAVDKDTVLTEEGNQYIKEGDLLARGYNGKLHLYVRVGNQYFASNTLLG